MRHRAYYNRPKKHYYYMQPDIKNMDVYSEEFLTLFHDVLEKFVNDFDDMAQMKAIKQAQELLETLNQG